MARTKIIAWSLLLLAFGHFPSVLFGAARRGTYLNYDTNDEMRSQHQNRHLEENAGGGYERDFRSTNGGSRAAEGHFHYMLVGAAREGRYLNYDTSNEMRNQYQNRYNNEAIESDYGGSESRYRMGSGGGSGFRSGGIGGEVGWGGVGGGYVGGQNGGSNYGKDRGYGRNSGNGGGYSNGGGGSFGAYGSSGGYESGGPNPGGYGSSGGGSGSRYNHDGNSPTNGYRSSSGVVYSRGTGSGGRGGADSADANVASGKN